MNAPPPSQPPASDEHLPRVTVAEPPTGVSPPPRRIDSRLLFDAAQELEIDHRGQVYRLRRTSTGKLILTK